VALQRASVATEQTGVHVRWLHAGLVGAPLSAGTFDSVSAQYPALLRTPGHDAERSLIAAVAPGGLLIVVRHASTLMRRKPTGSIRPTM
jgi:hypothetical protein